MASPGERAVAAPPAAVPLLLAALLAAGCGLFGGRHGTAPAPGGRAAVDWPIDGPVSSTFGPRGRTHHDGIDIAVPSGTPVRAAADGTVIFSGALRGYGNTVILDHRGGLTTVYAHQRENLVRAGESVRRGDRVGLVGESGKTTGPNLHFEVRKNKIARDPLAFLPARKSQVARGASAPSRRGGTGG